MKVIIIRNTVISGGQVVEASDKPQDIPDQDARLLIALKKATPVESDKPAKGKKAAAE